MFSKVDLRLPCVDISRLKGRELEKYGPDNAKLSLYEIKDMAYFRSLHSGAVKFGKMPECVFYTEITGTGLVNPHTDPVVRVALNYYIEPAECTTKFYRLTRDVSPILSVQEIESDNSRKNLSAKAYRLEDLDETGHFVAQPGEAFLMSTETIHSVLKPNNITRQFITYRWWSYSFDEIVDSIIIPK